MTTAPDHDLEGSQPQVAARLHGLDRLRGLAVVLMILDHVLVVLSRYEPAPWIDVVRLTVTRPSFVLFGLLAGMMLARRGRAASALMVGPALWACVWPLFFPTGLADPDILAVFVIVLYGLGNLVLRWPAVLGAVGVIQAFTWPLPGSNYQMGSVVALVALGVLAWRSADPSGWDAAGRRLPVVLEGPGSRPVLWYCAHLLVLSALVVSLDRQGLAGTATLAVVLISAYAAYLTVMAFVALVWRWSLARRASTAGRS